MIAREMAAKLRELVTQYPVISVSGPRQSGKTTLVRAVFSTYEYLSFENPDVMQAFEDDPNTFLSRHSGHVIFDEAQKAPRLFSYLQGICDENGVPGQFILTGSQNFLLAQAVSQSLAGRVALFTLLPLSCRELLTAGQKSNTLDELLFRGGYPRLYDSINDPADFFPDYIQTYLERDVRAEFGVRNLSAFRRFIQICALRCSELLNVSSMASDCGITVNTAREWLSTLEASHVVYRLQPYYSNTAKRLTKTPKLYFLDSGLAAYLMGIESAEDIYDSGMKGKLFETYVVSELLKFGYARKRIPHISFWRDSNKQEIDLLIERGPKVLRAIEVKSSATYNTRYFDILNRIGGTKLELSPDQRAVVYGGTEHLHTNNGELIPYFEVGSLLT